MPDPLAAEATPTELAASPLLGEYELEAGAAAEAKRLATQEMTHAQGLADNLIERLETEAHAIAAMVENLKGQPGMESKVAELEALHQNFLGRAAVVHAARSLPTASGVLAAVAGQDNGATQNLFAKAKEERQEAGVEAAEGGEYDAPAADLSQPRGLRWAKDFVTKKIVGTNADMLKDVAARYATKPEHATLVNPDLPPEERDAALANLSHVRVYLTTGNEHQKLLQELEALKAQGAPQEQIAALQAKTDTMLQFMKAYGEKIAEHHVTDLASFEKALAKDPKLARMMEAQVEWEKTRDATEFEKALSPQPTAIAVAQGKSEPEKGQAAAERAALAMLQSEEYKRKQEEQQREGRKPDVLTAAFDPTQKEIKDPVIAGIGARTPEILPIAASLASMFDPTDRDQNDIPSRPSVAMAKGFTKTPGFAPGVMTG